MLKLRRIINLLVLIIATLSFNCFAFSNGGGSKPIKVRNAELLKCVNVVKKEISITGSTLTDSDKGRILDELYEIFPNKDYNFFDDCFEQSQPLTDND